MIQKTQPKAPLTPLVSVVVPCYNSAQCVSQTIASVLDQSYGNIELIVVENGSTDDSRKVLRDIVAERNDSRFVVLEIDKNEGLVPAWHLGFRLASGKYFALLPAGDSFLPGKLEKQVRHLEANPHIGGLGTHVRQIDENGDRSGGNLIFENWVNQDIDLDGLKNWILEHRLCISTALYRKDFCDLAGPPTLGLNHICDYEFHLRLIEWGARFEVLPEVLTCYRSHNPGSGKGGRHTALIQWIYCYSKYIVPMARRRHEMEHIRTAIFRFLHRHQPWFEQYPKPQRLAILNEIFHPRDWQDFDSFHRHIEDADASGGEEECHLLAILRLMQKDLETRSALETLAAASAATGGAGEAAPSSDRPRESASEVQRKNLLQTESDLPAETLSEPISEVREESRRAAPGETRSAAPLKSVLQSVRKTAMASLGRGSSAKSANPDVTLQS